MSEKDIPLNLRIKYWVKNSPTALRWAIIICLFYGLLRIFGFQAQEFKVSILLVWYGILSCGLASLLSYVYGKVNYHDPENDSMVYGQVGIFIGTLLFSGLVILGTYIAQYH